MIGDPASQRQPEFGNLRHETSLGPFCQEVRTIYSVDNGLDDRPASYPQDIGRHRVQLDARILQNLMDAVVHSVALLSQFHTVAREIALFACLARWHVAGLNEAMSQQLC